MLPAPLRLRESRPCPSGLSYRTRRLRQYNEGRRGDRATPERPLWSPSGLIVLLAFHLGGHGPAFSSSLPLPTLLVLSGRPPSCVVVCPIRWVPSAGARMPVRVRSQVWPTHLRCEVRARDRGLPGEGPVSVVCARRESCPAACRSPCPRVSFIRAARHNEGSPTERCQG